MGAGENPPTALDGPFSAPFGGWRRGPNATGNSHYRSGRVDHWPKVKNPAAPAYDARPRRIGATNVGRKDGEGETAVSEAVIESVTQRGE